ncbi:MAG: hypothetical protein JW990_18225, partial [Thermoleophilia bacterium]|nr:hypothetical protein [Thermoleophilia bacterium]
HGQVRPIAEPFEVANRKGVLEYLMFPGDRSLGASAENVIQCCCASLTEKPGVSDPATYDEYGAADTDNSVVPLVVYMPEPVRKAGAFTLDDLRTIVAKDKGWAPGPNAGWRRLDEETQTNEPEPGVPERSNDDGQRTDEAQLADLEADANARLKQWEAERAASTNRYKNKAPKELNDLHANFDSQVARLRENKRSAELNNTGWGAGDEEALQMKIERLNDIRAEVASRRQYYGIQRQIKAIEMSRERGVPVLERSQVESLLGNVGDAYADAGVRGRGYTPEAFHVSHLSGRPVRWYVTLPDGRIAHPDEIHEARQRGRLAVIDNIVPDDRDWTQD